MTTENDPGFGEARAEEFANTRPCHYCGSLACEWEGSVLLGCTDCGYDCPDWLVPSLGPNTPYEITDPKHPDHYEHMVDIWDAREGK